MASVALSEGSIHYRVAGAAAGRPVLFVHGLLVDGTLWDPVVARLTESCRCVVPDLPLGSHRTPLNAGADRSPRGIARLLAELIEALGLEGATLVANDTGGAITQLLVAERPELVGGLVLTPCDAFENFLPPLFRPLQWLARSQGAVDRVVGTMRAAPLRQATYRTLTATATAAQTAAWVAPALGDASIRADLRATLGAIDPADTVGAADQLRRFTGPARVVWPVKARVFPFAHAERLAALLPGGELLPLPPGRAFVPLDQPAPLADAILDLVGQRAA